jgi:hypothetical protein
LLWFSFVKPPQVLSGPPLRLGQRPLHRYVAPNSGLIYALFTAASGLAQAPGALELEAIQTFPVPYGYDVHGAMLLSDGALVGWGAGGIFMLTGTGTLRSLENGLVFESRGLRVLDGSIPTFEVVDWRGALAVVGLDASPGRLPLPREDFKIVQSTWVPDGWFVLAEGDPDGSRSQQLWFFPLNPGPDGEPRPPLAYRFPPWDNHSVRLSAAGRHLLVTEIATPFRTWRLTPRSEEILADLVHRDDLVAQQVDALGFSPERMAALPTLRLDCGYLIQLSELSDDRRLIILVDETGRLIRSSTIRVALGFMVSEPDSRLLLAFRDVGMQEFVLYQWSWGARDYRSSVPHSQEAPCNTEA